MRRGNLRKSLFRPTRNLLIYQQLVPAAQTLFFQDLLKTHSEKLALKGMDWVIFVADLIAYAFVAVFLSNAKFMGGEYSNESCKVIYYAVVNLLVFVLLFIILNQMLNFAALGRLHWS